MTRKAQETQHRLNRVGLNDATRQVAGAVASATELPQTIWSVVDPLTGERWLQHAHSYWDGHGGRHLSTEGLVTMLPATYFQR